jgi:hypothetical protein
VEGRSEAAEAYARAVACVEMDPGRAARLEKILQAKEKQAKQVEDWKLKHEAHVKAARKRHYDEHRLEKLEDQKCFSEEQKELCTGAVGGSATATSKFGVAAGCRCDCSPALCLACYQPLKEDRHPVHLRIRDAYEIKAVDEVQLPVDPRA